MPPIVSIYKPYISESLKMEAYSWQTVHYLKTRLKIIVKLGKFKQLFKRHGGKNILFINKKLYTVEEKFNRQNRTGATELYFSLRLIKRNLHRNGYKSMAMRWINDSLVKMV